MPLLRVSEWRIAEAVAAIPYCNPFLPERLELERRILGGDYVETGTVIRARPGAAIGEIFPHVWQLHDRTQKLVDSIRSALAKGRRATQHDLQVYEDLALFLLYHRFLGVFETRVQGSTGREIPAGKVSFWDEFKKQFHELFHVPGQHLPSTYAPEAIFAGFFQFERAFTHIFDRIIGGSMPAARLRAAVWDSIFTRDLRRYIRVLHQKMADVPTLITGPSGSGKELVARAIGMSCFIPFDTGSRSFASGQAELYVPVNLAALAPMLIESELFGHVKGAFTTAARDRQGWLETCGPYGAVFLDEIGELDGSIQVKLLRVLEYRTFQKVGDTRSIRFAGKIIAATSRDLAAEMHAGRFRQDLYYRLCADQISTPSLAEQLADRPDDLVELVRFIVRDILARKPSGEARPTHDPDLTREVETLTEEVVTWINRSLPRDYAWPGNFRELGQCVRNVMIRGSYRPASRTAGEARKLGPAQELLDQVRAVAITADELLSRYYALAFDRADGNYREAGRRLGVDWRVVKSRLDQAFLGRLRQRRSDTDRSDPTDPPKPAE